MPNLIAEADIKNNTVVHREMTEAELVKDENHRKQVAESEQAKAEAEAQKAAAKQALLDKLGITAEEAQLLLGGN
jgi:hypothetical protein